MLNRSRLIRFFARQSRSSFAKKRVTGVHNGKSNGNKEGVVDMSQSKNSRTSYELLEEIMGVDLSALKKEEEEVLNNRKRLLLENVNEIENNKETVEEEKDNTKDCNSGAEEYENEVSKYLTKKKKKASLNNYEPENINIEGSSEDENDESIGRNEVNQKKLKKMSSVAQELCKILNKIENDEIVAEEVDIELDRALGCKDEAIKYPFIKEYLSKIFLAGGNTEIIRDEYERLAAMREGATENKEQDIFLYFIWGLVEEVDGNIELSKELFYRAMATEPQNQMVMLDLAAITRRQKDFSKARQIYQAAANALPGRAVIYKDWSKMEYTLGNKIEGDALFHCGIQEVIKVGDMESLNTWALQEEIYHKNHESARLILKKMVSAFGDTSAYPWQAWGNFEMRLQNFKDGRMLFEKALYTHAGDYSTWIFWGEMEEKCLHWDYARSIYRRGASATFSTNKEISAKCWLALAKVENKLGNNIAVRNVLNEAHDMHETNFEIYKNLVENEWIIDNNSARDMLSSFAISISNNQFLDISTQEDPEKKTLSKNEIDRLICNIFTLWGDLEMKIGNRAVAKEKYNHSLTLVSNHGEAFAGLGMIELCEGRGKSALSLFFKGACNDKCSSLCYRYLGSELLKLKRFEEARKSFKAGLDNNPFDTEISIEWGKMEYLLGNYKNAKDRLEIARHFDPQNDLVYERLAQIEMKENNKAMALRHFQAAAKFKPTNYKHWLYAATLMSEDTPLEAAKWLNDGLKIITNAKERSFMFTLKGKSEALIGKHEMEAENSFKEALALVPTNHPAHYFYASLVLEPQGRFAEARDHYGAALKIVDSAVGNSLKIKMISERENIINGLKRIKSFATNA